MKVLIYVPLGLPPEGAERKTRLGAESLDLSNMSDCSQYKQLLELVNKYDLEDVSVSEVPDKILPPTGKFKMPMVLRSSEAHLLDRSIGRSEFLWWVPWWEPSTDTNLPVDYPCTYYISTAIEPAGGSWRAGPK